MAQFGRPNSDEASGNWSYSTGSTLYGTIDETTASESDFNYSGVNPSNDTFEVGLSSVTDPGVHTGHVYRYRYELLEGGGGSGTVTNITCALYQGTGAGRTLIDSDTQETVKNSWITSAITLSEAQAANITDYSDLYIEISANKISGGKDCEVYVSWVEFETPDVTGQALVETVSETEHIAESIYRVLAMARTSTETEHIAESVYRALAMARSVEETEEIAESVYAMLSRVRSVDETEHLFEQVVTVLGFIRNVDDIAHIAESVTAMVERLATVSETEHVVESVYRALTIARAIDETEHLSEGVSAKLARVRTISELEHIAETVYALMVKLRVIDETESIVENVAVLKAMTRAVLETEHIVETTTVARAMSRVTDETEVIAETVARALQIVRPTDETEHIAESVSRALALVRSVDETEHIAETVAAITSAADALVETVSETEHIVEAVTAVLKIVRSTDDVEHIAENIVLALDKIRSVDETEHIVEDVARVLSMVRSVDETEYVAETVYRILGKRAVVSETIEVVESALAVIFSTLLVDTADVAEIVETVFAKVERIATTSEVAHIAENVARVMDYVRTADDTAHIVESVAVVANWNRAVSETVEIVETSLAVVSGVGQLLIGNVAETVHIAEAAEVIKKMAERFAPYGNLFINESFEYIVAGDETIPRLWQRMANKISYTVRTPKRVPGAGRLGGGAMELKSDWERWQAIIQNGVHLPLSVGDLTTDNEFAFWFKPTVLSDAGGNWPELEISLVHYDGYNPDGYDWINVTLTLDPAVYPIGEWHRYYTNNHRPPAPPGTPRFWLNPEYMYDFEIKLHNTDSASLGTVLIDDVLLGHDTAWEGTLAIMKAIRAAVVTDLEVLANASVEELPKDLSEVPTRTVFFMEGPGGTAKAETFGRNETRQVFRLGLFIRASNQVDALADLDDFSDEVRNIIERDNGTTNLHTQVRTATVAAWTEVMTSEDIAQGDAYRELEVEVFYSHTLGSA